MYNYLFKWAGLLVVVLALSVQSVQAQIPLSEKRIFILDLTGSMEGKGTSGSLNILQDVKNQLTETIEDIEDPNTELVVIPFTNKPYAPLRGRASNKDELIAVIKRLDVLPGDTNIADAWLAGLQELDERKVNYMFLLTDGLHNTGPDKSVLYERLSGWEESSRGKNEYAFYVVFTQQAKELEICDIVDKTPQMWLIDNMNINAALIRTEIVQRKNIFEEPSTSLKFFTNNRKAKLDQLDLKIEFEENDLYAIKNLERSLDGDEYTFKIEEKRKKINLPLDTTLALKLSIDKQKNPFVFLTPEVVSFQVVNQGPRKLIIKETGLFRRKLSHLDMGSLCYKEPFQGPFAWARSIYEPTLSWPFFSWAVPLVEESAKSIIVSFNEEAVRAGSNVTFSLIDSSSEYADHLESWLIGEQIITASSQSQEVSLGVRVLPGIPSSSFSGDVVVVTDKVDVVNDKELTSNQNIVGSWEVYYKRGCPWLLWIVWGVMTLLALAIAILLAFFLIKLLGALLHWILTGRFIKKSKWFADRKRFDFSNLRFWLQEGRKLDEEEAKRRYPDVERYVARLKERLGYNTYAMSVEIIEVMDGVLILKGVDDRPNQLSNYAVIIERDVYAYTGNAKGDGHLNEFLNNPDGMIPNMRYHLENVTYVIDDKGRVNETYEVHSAKNPTDRCDARPQLKTVSDAKGGRDSDVGGHIVAHNVDGPTEAINIVPMDAGFNNDEREGQWKAMEKVILDAYQSGKTVLVHKRLRYPGDSLRPNNINVEYKVEGGLTEMRFWILP